MNRTDNFSGAYLQEIVQSAFMLAHEDCGYCNEPVITQTDLERALTQMEAQRATVSREKGLSYSGGEMTIEQLYN